MEQAEYLKEIISIYKIKECELVMIEHRDLKYWKSEILKYSNKVNESFLNVKDRIELTEVLLDGIRNFISSVECYVHKSMKNLSFPSRYEEIDKSNSFCSRNANLNFLSKFYNNLNASVGHQNFIGEYAERLGLKYISQLISVKDFLNKQFGINVLSNISLFPFDLDDSFKKYYKEIIAVLDKKEIFTESGEKGTYYIQKKKMIYIDNALFYEYVFTNALDNNSKFDRFIAFSLLNIPTNYAIQASSLSKEIVFFNQHISYMVITNFKIAIRPCEIEKLSTIVNVATNYTSKSGDYYRLMDFLKNENANLVDVVNLSKDNYSLFKGKVFTNGDTIISRTIDETRRIVLTKQSGYKTILYLLYTMNNDVLSKQLARNEEESFDNIRLKKGTYAFEKSPFSSGLINHVPSFNNLINIFDYNEHKTEILARTISNLSNESSCIYIPLEKVSPNDVSDIVKLYNSQFTKESLQHRRVLQFGKYLFLAENEIDTLNFIEVIKNYVNSINFPHYKNYSESRIKELGLNFDDADKEKTLKILFENSSVFVVYGPAGTGKSYFASYVLKVLKGINKICIASTNPAVDNMKRKFDDASAKYMTITKYLKDYRESSAIDLLIIDECSTVSTKDICKVLNQTKPKLVLLLGDIFQIQSIAFGNWFALIREFIPKRCYIDLKSQYRTESETLIDFWKEVRSIGPNIQEKLAMNQISSIFDDSLFEKKYRDEIILCLNYDGLYGINNLNKVLQNANINKSYSWKQYTFKIGDPIIFNDNLRYRDVFYNNLKGVIENIEEILNGFRFTIRVKKILNPVLCASSDVEIISIEDEETIVRFEFNKYSDDVYDRDTGYSSSIPFQIAYALSIHKAQGLEYDSVKIVISNEVEENVTHNIFYTAITRARRNLTIYWTPETEKKIIGSLELMNYGVDASILKQRMKASKKTS